MIVQESQAITVPGTQFVLTYDRDEESGRLLRVRYDDREYLRWQEGEYVFGGGLAIVREAITPQKLLRSVRTNRAIWTEEYRWDDQGRLSYVDGVEMQRDDRNRITACIGSDSAWYYGYANDQLTVVETPSNIRHLTWDAEKRPYRIRENQQIQDIHYNAQGGRLDIPVMSSLWNRDEWGRLWCIQDTEGRILTTYLWDGFACWGRIDGSPGDPLAAVFSLDPSLTPVRVITPQGMTQIPRDAYGEGLLKYPGVPGLHGGAVHQGFVYLRSRSIDPRVGAFNAPDPWHGLEDDPRRNEGYQGALIVETSATGTYAVCQFDPVGRTDPTGEISFFLGLSTLTWSSQHNIAGFFFLELFLNFVFAFFSGNPLKRLLDIEAYKSKYHGGWGFRFDPIGIESLGINKGRAWTYQHIIWAQRSEFDELAWARAFVPSNAFKPTCYGTLLQVTPQYGLEASDPAIPILLRGASNFTGGQIPGRALGWTRSGGVAEPAIPGSQVPIFPKGGIHFDQAQEKIIAPQDATIAELQPNGSLITGNLQERMVLVIPKTGLALANGNLLLITGAAGRTELAEIRDQAERSSQTRVRLVADPTAIGTGLRVRRLGAVLSTQAMTLGTQPNRLKAQGVPIKYTQGNPLRLKQAGAVVGAVVIEKLEARLAIDTPLSKPRSRPPYKVSHAQLSGVSQNVTVNSPQLVTFPAGSPVPNEGDAIAIQAAGQTMAVLITGKPGDRQRQIDRPLLGTIASAAAGSVKWRPLRSILPLGTWDGTVDANPQITYTPDRSGIAPATDHLLIVDGDNKTVAVRDIKSITFDELVFPNPLPGVAANPYDVEQFGFQPPDEANASLEKVKALVLKPPVDATLKAVPKPAIHLHWLSGAALNGTPLTSGNPVLANVPLAADKVILNPSTSAASYPLGLNNTQAPTPSQLMLLKSGANAEAAIVQQVQLTVTVDRPLGLAAGAKLEAVPLKLDGIAYQAESLPGNKVVLKPIAVQLDAADNYDRDAAGNTKKVDVLMSRFTVGEVIQAMWVAGGITQREYFRIKTVEGTLLELEGGVAAMATPTPTDLVILRMSPTDPKTGSSRIGIEGNALAPNKIQFKVWQPNALKAGDIIAVTDSIKTLPAKVASQDELKIEFFPRPGATITTGTIDLVVPNLQGFIHNSLYLSDYTLEGNDLLLPSSVPLAVTPELFVGILFQEPRAGAKIKGRLSAGTVMIPQDSTETWEIDRRDSLKTHELRHTQQSARLGPLFLQLIPWFALNAGALALGSDIEKPEYSPYIKGSLVTEGSNRFLDIPDFQNVEFESDDDVQLSQNLLSRNLKLGTRSGNRFQISGSDLFQTGTVFVRQLKSELGKTLADIYAWGELDSVGGLMQALIAPILTGIPWLIIQTVQAAKGNSFGSHYWLDYFPAQVSDPNKPSAIVLSPVDGKSLQLQPNDSVEIKVAGSTDRTTVTAVAADGSVELKDPPRTEGDNRRLEIAKLADDDPLGSVVSTPLNEMGFGSLRWLFDPYGQLQFRARPQVQGQSPTFEDWFLRSLRWGFSSTSWVGFPFAIFFFDNLLPQSKGKGHLSWMEQGASEQSGEVYSPIGRLYGTLEYVGDIARYWYYPTNNTSTSLLDSRQDAPGVHIQPNVRLLPSFRDNPAAAGTLNQKREADPTSGIQLPDWLANKLPRNPAMPPATAPVGFLTADRGWIPSSSELERSCGAYVAFTRPGSHFVTLNDTIAGASEAREAQENKDQTIFFEKTVRDVTVKVAGQAKNNGDTVKLVQCQRAVIEVEPGGDRRYSVTMMRPKDGDVLRKGGDLILQAQTTNNTETIEITRDYISVAAGARKDDNRLFPEIHLGGNFSVPVRSLKVEVGDQVDVRSHLNLTDPPLQKALPGANDAFILVPAKITAPARPKVTYTTVTTPKSTDPTLAVVPEKLIPSDLKAFLGDGGILKVTFAENDPPEEEVTVEWRIDVSANQLDATGKPKAIAGVLKASIKLEPHFRLLLPVAGTFQVAKGANLTLEAKSAGGNVNVANVIVTKSQGITTTIAGNKITIAVDATAETGTHTVVVEDATNPKHKARRTIEIT